MHRKALLHEKGMPNCRWFTDLEDTSPLANGQWRGKSSKFDFLAVKGKKSKGNLVDKKEEESPIIRVIKNANDEDDWPTNEAQQEQLWRRKRRR